ncbi:MAG: CCDC90 family protein [Alphaproteobacteria bacterium]
MSASSVLRLQKVGFTVEQVEALADFMDTQAASKADLERETGAIRAEAAETKAELKAEIVAVRADLRQETTRLESIIELAKRDITIKLGGMLVVVTGVLLAAIRYLPPHP